MNESQVRWLVILGLLAAVATAVQVLWEPSSAPWDPDATSVIWEVSLPEVTAVTVNRGEATFTVERRGEAWWMTSPKEAPADPASVHDLIDMLQEIDVGIPVPDAEPERFGLGDFPVATVSVLMAGQSRELVVGHDAPTGRRTYVLDAEGAVAAALGRLERDLPRHPDELRDKAPFRMSAGAVTRVSITSEDGDLVVYEEGDRWWVEGFTRARPSRVDELVGGLLDLRVDELQEGLPLAEPTYVVEITGAEGAVQSAQVGPLFPASTRLVSSRIGEGTLPGDQLALLVQGPNHVGDHRAFPVDPLASERVELRLGELVAVITRVDWDWAVESGVVPSEDPHEFLIRLHDVPIRYRRTSVPAAQEEWGRVTVMREGERRLDVTVGQVVDERWRVAQDQAGGEPYLVPMEILDLLISGQPVPQLP